jgi:hypothetical protein
MNSSLTPRHLPPKWPLVLSNLLTAGLLLLLVIARKEINTDFINLIFAWLLLLFVAQVYGLSVLVFTPVINLPAKQRFPYALLPWLNSLALIPILYLYATRRF